MRVLLTNSPSRSAINQVAGIRTPPLGLGYLAAIAEQAGHEVRVVDAPTVGLTREQLVQQIDDDEPDLLGVSATANGFQDALRVVVEAKRKRPGLYAVLGGPHVTFLDEQTLQDCRAVDAVARGEGEETFRQLMEAVVSGAEPCGIAGLTYRRNGTVLRNPDRPLIADLDPLPFPAYHLLPMDRYALTGTPYACIMTSRGCPYHCTFCASSHLFGNRWRSRSPESVVEEMAYLRERFGVEYIEMVDDTFSVSHRRVDAICDLLISRKLDVCWTASARVGSLNEPILRKMKAAGCRAIFLGFESGSQDVLDYLCKGVRVEDAFETMDLVRRVGLEVVGSFILGSPQDTEDTVRETIRFARKLSPNYAQFSILTPYPGTPLYEEALAKGWLTSPDWSQFDILRPVMKTPGISAKKLKRHLDWAFISFYLRPRFLWQEVRRRNLHFISRALKGLSAYIRE